MKLAFCLFHYFPYGGLQRDFLRIAKICLERGHIVHVYTMRWVGETVSGLELHIIKAHGLQNHTRIRSFVKKLKSQLALCDYDLVVGFNKMPDLDLYYAADVCYQARVRETHSFLYRLSPRYRQFLAFETSVFARGSKTQILSISLLEQQAFMRYYKTQIERFYLLPPGIEKDRIACEEAGQIRSSLRTAYHIGKDDILLLMVGSGFKTKGVDRAIISLAALPPALKARCHLYVIGREPNLTPFQALASQLDVAHKIHFLGGRLDVPTFLLSADLLLHPAYHENTGTVLLEAMVSGLPVLTVDTCGYAHYVQKADTGVVLPSPFRQAAWNDALEKMLFSAKRAQWQQNGLAFAKIADIYALPEKAAERIEQIGEQRYITLLAKKEVRIDGHDALFKQIMALRGERFRYQEGRLTQRLSFRGKQYFIKQHAGIGWKEIIKNLVQLRLPVISAKNEWRAISKLRSLGVSVPVVLAYGECGFNPAYRQSFILMESLTPVMSLEELGKEWQQKPPSFTVKRKLIEAVAHIAKTLHQNGINHRDFYLCHFLLDISSGIDAIHLDQIKLYLIDLHRAQIRSVTPKRWIMKDLASLLFSAKNFSLTKGDLYRFIKHYHNKSWCEMQEGEKIFWQQIKKRGDTYRDHTK